jgi:NAD(P)-dependent dehydrogenase (short-subunit alcohol dehydrogenase family)
MKGLIDLADRVILVSGAATGIGAATVALVLQAGASVVATDISDAGDVLRAALTDGGERVVFERLDVTQADDWSRVVRSTRERFGVINGLVNNAGTLGSGNPVHLEDEAVMRRVFDVNTMGMMLGMKAVIPGMIEIGFGFIVNVSSVWGVSGVANNVAYQTAKGAAVMLSRNAGVTYAPMGIQVNCIIPGYVRTPMSDGVTTSEAELLLAMTPVGRRAEPAEVAPMIGFLLSDGARFIAATTIPVDGGMAAL